MNDRTHKGRSYETLKKENNAPKENHVVRNFLVGLTAFSSVFLLGAAAQASSQVTVGDLSVTSDGNTTVVTEDGKTSVTHGGFSNGRVTVSPDGSTVTVQDGGSSGTIAKVLEDRGVDTQKLVDNCNTFVRVGIPLWLGVFGFGVLGSSLFRSRKESDCSSDKQGIEKKTKPRKTRTITPT